MSALEHAAPAAGTVAPRLSRPFVAALMLANFGTNVALIAPIQNVLPRMVEAVTGAGGKALALGLVTGIGAFAALIANPVAGHYSDRWVSTDNRVATILVGLVTGGTAHVILGYQHSVVSIAIWWTICQATINIAYGPMSAIVVDHVDRRSWGLVWGLISVAQAVGLIIGLAAVVYVFPSVTAGMTAISVGYVVCLIPLLVVLHRLPRVSYARPRPRAPSGGRASARCCRLSRGSGWSGPASSWSRSRRRSRCSTSTTTCRTWCATTTLARGSSSLCCAPRSRPSWRPSPWGAWPTGRAATAGTRCSPRW